MSYPPVNNEGMYQNYKSLTRQHGLEPLGPEKAAEAKEEQKDGHRGDEELEAPQQRAEHVDPHGALPHLVRRQPRPFGSDAGRNYNGVSL